MMVARRALAAAGCSHCRSAVLKLFVGPATLPHARAPISTTWHPALAHQMKRSFSSATKPAEVSGTSESREEPSRPIETRHEMQEFVDATPQSSPTDTPWYLQVEPPRHAAVTQPPPLPDIAEDAPPILASLLEYSAEEMGLDELSLLDLRALDPPPALGPNLFMLFGTARSERHLNVSAGRLVRWLRAKHRVVADADGLLGPNERKTKLKRKAKRAKLLGTMGTDDTDDGISTGWVCVNLGTINRGSGESSVVSDDGRFAGFSVPQTSIGSTIIVQIMTESRRAELDLETLWQRQLARQTKKAIPTEGSAKSEVPALERAVSAKVHSRPMSNANQLVGPATVPPGQSRLFSTGARASSNQTRMSLMDSKSGDPLLSDPATLLQVLSYDGPQKQRLTELLSTHIDRLWPEDAVLTLNSPTFQRLAELAMQNLPTEQTWPFRLALETASHRAQTRGRDRSIGNVESLINEFRLHKMPATREQCLQLLFCVYSAPRTVLDVQTSLALELLESLHLRGQKVIANDVIVAIIEALSWRKEAHTDSVALQRRLEELMLQAKLPCMEEPLLIRLMDAYARQNNWSRFWEIWRIPPRYLRPRSEAMYLHVYRLMAATKSARLCIDTLRRCFQEMLIENPPVQPVGRMRDAIFDCIRVVDPLAEEHAASIVPNPRLPAPARRLSNRETVRLVRALKLMG